MTSRIPLYNTNQLLVLSFLLTPPPPLRDLNFKQPFGRWRQVLEKCPDCSCRSGESSNWSKMADKRFQRQQHNSLFSAVDPSVPFQAACLSLGDSETIFSPGFLSGWGKLPVQIAANVWCIRSGEIQARVLVSAHSWKLFAVASFCFLFSCVFEELKQNKKVVVYINYKNEILKFSL